MFSYRKVICNRGTLNGRILRFGGRTGVLRSSYQAALQVAALHIGALHINALQIAVLQINALQINDCDQFFSLDSAAGLGHQQPEAWILGCILSYGNRLLVFGHPACDSLPHAQFQAIYDFRVRSFRCPKHKLVTLKHVNQTAIALHQR
jgi:hypothetical protein